MKKPDVTRSFVVQELQLRYKNIRLESPATVRCSADVAAFLQPLISWKPREVLVSIAVGTQNEVIGLEYVAQGTNMSSPAVPGEIFKALLLCNASAFIVAHNHPHGNPDPSDNDRTVASLTAHAAALLGLKMLDFVIVARDRHHSLEDSTPAWREHPFEGRPHGSKI
jgi:DNA repair protein RadC